VSFLDHATGPGDVVVLPEAALSGYDDALSGLDDLDLGELETVTNAVADAVCRRGVHLVCGAQIFAYPTYAANPREPAGVWRSHLVSRAAETQRFVVAANVAHPDQHCPSMIISPRGEVLAETSTCHAACLRAELELADVRDDYLSQQRGDVVALVQMTS
jgi:predicted amidohydrolase